MLIEATKRKASIALLQEPYVGRERKVKSYRGARIFQCTNQRDGVVKAAIAIFDHDLDVTLYPTLTTNNIVVVKVRTTAWEVFAVSFYFEPDQPIEPYLGHLKKIRDELGSNRLIVAGDTNAKSTWWGSNTVDHRGEEMSGALEEMDLQILNVGDIPTFSTVRGGKTYASHVDVTACTADLYGLAEDWRVVEDLTSSDHNGIIFQLKMEKAMGFNVKRTTRLYNTKKANWEGFHEQLDQLLLDHSITEPEINKIASIEYTQWVD